MYGQLWNDWTRFDTGFNCYHFVQEVENRRNSKRPSQDSIDSKKSIGNTDALLKENKKQKEQIEMLTNNNIKLTDEIAQYNTNITDILNDF